MINLPNILTGTLRRMHYVQRYSSVPVLNPENVAEHSWQIAMISYMLSMDINHNWQPATVDIEEVLVKAIVHDVSEALSGDIIRSYKHSSPAMRAACQEADRLNMAKLMDEVGREAGFQLTADWANAKDDSLEGEIVALADLLCVVSYCVNERTLGSRACDFILKELYTETLCHWHQHKYLGVYVDQLFPRKMWHDPYTRTN